VRGNWAGWVGMVGSGMLRLPLWVEQRQNTASAHGGAMLMENGWGGRKGGTCERRPQKSRHDL
jgi:hypothetical protein